MLNSFNYMLGEIVESCDYIFQINNYQRFYVWSVEKVQTYIDDIEATIARLVRDPSSVHYFGQMIFLEKDLDRRGRHTYEVIDGQQRLTTFLMLISAIKGHTLKLRMDFPDVDAVARELETRCEKYIKSVKSGVPTVNKLSLASQDDAYYQAILHHLSTTTAVPQEVHPISHKFLYTAQLIIRQAIERIINAAESPDEKIAKLSQLVDVASGKFQIITIIPTAEAYTYQLYQVVNDRGEPLKDSELLKAKSIEVLAGDATYTEEAKRIWNDILCDPGSETEKYLAWCYMSKIGSDKSESRYYHAYLKNYFCIRDNAVLTIEEQENYLHNLRGLHEDIRLCRKLARGEWPFENATCQQWQRNVLSNLIVGMKHTLCIPVLISAFRQPNHHGVITEQNFYNCLELCETFFILIKGVFRMREDKFKSKYLSASVNMRIRPLEYRSTQFKNDLKQIEPGTVTHECLGRLQNMAYAPKAANSTLKYLVILLETYLPSFDVNNIPHSNRVPDGTNLVYSELSLEHIYAETALPTFQNEELEAQKHKLGNLLIYGRNANSRLKSKPYVEKIPYYTTSRFTMVTKLVESHPTDWTAHDFILRQQDVCEKLKNLLLRFY